MILSLDGAAAVNDWPKPLSDRDRPEPAAEPARVRRRGARGAGTVRAEGYGPVRLTADQIAERRRRWGIDTAPPIAVVPHRQPAHLAVHRPDRPPILVTTAQLIRSRPELAGPADVVIAGESVVDIGPRSPR